jgi:hypothetical protein
MSIKKIVFQIPSSHAASNSQEEIITGLGALDGRLLLGFKADFARRGG